MQTYKVYQIHLTEREVYEINKAGDHCVIPRGEAKMKTMFGNGKATKAAWKAGYYAHVADIDGYDLDNVFSIGNVGPEANIRRLSTMHSISVGDIIEDPNNILHVVLPFGWGEI